MQQHSSVEDAMFQFEGHPKTNISRISAAIFREWQTGLWALQQTNINPLCTNGS